ncbi:MAG: leucine-rich repeat protein [Alistipes sp.]|nr:leucine-rich repeat protein [Alistipes sp.]
MFRKFAAAAAAISMAVTAAYIPDVKAGEVYAPEYMITFSDNGDTVSVVGCDTSAVDVVIPSELGGKPVTEIADRAFFGCSELVSVKMADTIEKVGSMAFAECKSLESVKISGNIEVISEYAFYDCASLKSVGIPEGVTDVQWCAFAQCTSLKAVIIPSTIKKIGFNAFVDTPWLKDMYKTDSLLIFNNTVFSAKDHIMKAEIPAGVKKIGDEAFQGREYLTKATLSDGVETIGSYAFSECINLKKVTIPDSVTSIGNYAFNDCVKLETVGLSRGMNRLDDFVFVFCSGLSYIQIPENIHSIGDRALGSCTVLDAVVIEDPDCRIFDSSATISNDYKDNDYFFDGTIYGYKGSTAEDYAEKYGYKFGVIGDVNSDGEFSVADVVLAERFVLGADAPADWRAGDRDGDNIIDAYDIVLMKQLLVKG